MDLCGILCFHRFTRHHKAEDCEGSPDSHLHTVNCHVDDKQKSAFEVYRSNQAHTLSERQKSKPKSSKKGKSVHTLVFTLEFHVFHKLYIISWVF